MAPTTYKLRLDTEELEHWKKAAVQAGSTLAEWMRKELNDVAVILANGGNQGVRDAGPLFVDSRSAAAPERSEQSADQKLLCSHDYGPKACPIPGCPYYKWDRAKLLSGPREPLPKTKQKSNLPSRTSAPATKKSKNWCPHGIMKAGRCMRCPGGIAR